MLAALAGLLLAGLFAGTAIAQDAPTSLLPPALGQPTATPVPAAQPEPAPLGRQPETPGGQPGLPMPPFAQPSPAWQAQQSQGWGGQPGQPLSPGVRQQLIQPWSGQPAQPLQLESRQNLTQPWLGQPLPPVAQPEPAQPWAGQPGTAPSPPAQIEPAQQQQQLAPGPRILGTIPAGSLDGAVAGVPDGLGPAVSGGFGEELSRIAAPMPVAPVQRAMREILIDRGLVETSDPMARAAALFALGFAEDAAGAAIETVPDSVAERALTARTLLAVGHKEQACERADVESLPEDAEPAPTLELLEVLAFCKLEQGSREAAKLIADLLREQGGGDDLFFAALSQASEGGGKLPDADRVDRFRPIHFALFNRTGTPVPADYVIKADRALLGAIARSEASDAAARIAATERMVEAGLAPVSSLIGLYGTTSLDQQLLMQATSGVAPPGPLTRAHLFALIAEARDERERLGFISTLYAQARQAGISGAIAEAIGEDAAGVVADSSLGAAAPLMVEILTRADRARAALPWVDAGEFPGPDGRPALSRFAAHRIRALIAVSDPELGLGVSAGAFGSDAGGAPLSPAERQFLTAEVAIMTAFGDFISPVLADLGGRPVPPAPAGSAAGALAALAPLSGADLTTLDSSSLASALAALAGYGFETEARLFAVEALAARPAG